MLCGAPDTPGVRESSTRTTSLLDGRSHDSETPIRSRVALNVVTGGGGRSSTRLTVKVTELVLPRLSFARHVTVVSPSGNGAPGGGVQVTGTAPSTRSLANGST